MSIQDKTVTMAHGAGGRQTSELIDSVFAAHFANDDLTADDVIRHYDVTGKACPKYYVENQAAWEQFKSDLVDYIEVNGIAKTEEIQ